ncbi:MAG: hypothetical protein WAM70_04305, partial [Pyrinomonadaceae bacterium]
FTVCLGIALKGNFWIVTARHRGAGGNCTFPSEIVKSHPIFRRLTRGSIAVKRPSKRLPRGWFTADRTRFIINVYPSDKHF